MLAEVRAFIQRKELLIHGEAVQVAVSGGVDSMVLLHVLDALGHPCNVVHVDHGLRGAESEDDREFVEAYARQKDHPFLCAKVDVAGRMKADGGSVQMVARELRYVAFREAVRNGPGVLAMGHHQDDVVETLLMDLMRGVRLQGWGGIQPVTKATGVANGRFIRPLLCVDRERILAYAEEHGVPFREDSSNENAKYLRNRIRHEVMPLLERIQPGAAKVMGRSADLLRELSAAASQQVEMELGVVQRNRNGAAEVPFAVLENSRMPHLLLGALFPSDNIHPDVIAQLLQAVHDRSTGAVFMIGSKQVSVDRDSLFVVEYHDVHPTYIVESEQGSAGPFSWNIIGKEPSTSVPSMDAAWMNREVLRFPMVLRPWSPGDRMRPIGLNGSKLVSDILIDAKVPMAQKSDVYVLAEGSAVLWLEGHRMAEGVQVPSDARSAWCIARSVRSS